MVIKLELKEGIYTIIDDDDYEKVSQHRWHVTRHSNTKRYIIQMYLNGERFTLWSFIYGNTNGLEIDHINRNIFDNRKCNLRTCSRVDNIRNREKLITNTSGYKGVTYHKHSKCWVAQIHKNGKQIVVGRSKNDPIAAAIAYDNAAREIHGKFACLNFPTQEELPNVFDFDSIPITKQIAPKKTLPTSNTSGYRGVHWNKEVKRWGVALRINGKRKTIGYYNDKIKAALIYDHHAFITFGDDALLNFPDPSTRPNIDINEPEIRKVITKSNTSGYRGVGWSEKDKKWTATLIIKNKQVERQYFNNIINAALAFDDMARKYHGEKYTKVNFPDINNRPSYIDESSDRTKIIGKRNTSGYKGVIYLQKYNKWRATCSINGKNVTNSKYTDKISAALGYDEMVESNPNQKINKYNFPHYKETCNIDPSIINDIHIIPSST